jgi:hypothetical protein
MKQVKTFFLSFIEEAILNPKWAEFVAGRIKVYEMGSEKYAIEEIRFLTKKQKEYRRLRGKWDFGEATAKELERLRKKIIALGERVSRELEAEALANRDFYRAISKELETIGLETWL